MTQFPMQTILSPNSEPTESDLLAKNSDFQTWADIRSAGGLVKMQKPGPLTRPIELKSATYQDHQVVLVHVPS